MDRTTVTAPLPPGRKPVFTTSPSSSTSIGIDTAEKLEKVFTLKTTFEQSMMPTIEPQSSRSEEHTSELQSLMRISYAVFCLKKKKHNKTPQKQKKYNSNN